MTAGKRWKEPQRGPPQHGVEVYLCLGLAWKGEQPHDGQSDLSFVKANRKECGLGSKARAWLWRKGLNFMLRFILNIVGFSAGDYVSHVP